MRAAPAAARSRRLSGSSPRLRRRVELCGVFVNAPLEELVGVSEALGLTMLQLHGDEGPALCAEARRRTGARVIKAVQLAGPGDVRDLERFHVDFHLTDAARAPPAAQRSAGRHRGDLRLEPALGPALRGPADPQRRPERRERRGGGRARAPLRRRQRERHRVGSRPQGSRQARAFIGAAAARDAGSAQDVRRIARRPRIGHPA